MDRMAGWALAGAGLGGAGLAVAGLTGNLPVSKQQELEQLKAMNAVPSPELEQQARDEQVAQWGTAALAVGAGTGLGLLVDRFAGSPEVAEKLTATSAGSGGVAGNGLPLPVGPVSPPGGGWVHSGRLATDDEAQSALNFLTEYHQEKRLETKRPQDAMKYFSDLIASEGPQSLAEVIDFTKEHWDGIGATETDFIGNANKSYDYFSPDKELERQQAIINAIGPEKMQGRRGPAWMQEFFDYMREGHDDENIWKIIDTPMRDTQLAPEKRQLAAALELLQLRSDRRKPSQFDVEQYLRKLDHGNAADYLDYAKAKIEHAGGDPDALTMPQWALDYKGNPEHNRLNGKTFETTLISHEEDAVRNLHEASEMFVEAGMAPFTQEFIDKQLAIARSADQRRKRRLGL